MMITYNELYDVLRRERYSEQLQPIPKNFVKEVAAYLKETKQSFFKKIKSKFAYKITEKEFDEIFEDLEMLLLENNTALEVVEEKPKKEKKTKIIEEFPKLKPEEQGTAIEIETEIEEG
ncbi:unnamed protein product, partial [marine sediment metagenome]